jgi:hypothetical protein
MQQLGEVQDKLRRIHFKSLGAILTLQEQVARQWLGGLPVAAGVALAPVVLAEPQGSSPAGRPIEVPDEPPFGMACPGCRRPHQLALFLQGRRVRCKSCREAILVPAPHLGRMGEGEMVRRSTSPAKTDPFNRPSLGSGRVRSDDEIAERPDQEGPSAGQLAGALAAMFAFLVALVMLLVGFWTGKSSPGPGDQAAGAAPPQRTGQPGVNAALQASPKVWVVPPGLARVKLFRERPCCFLSRLKEFDVEKGPWPVRKGDNGEGQPIRVGGVLSPHGLGMHPPGAPGHASARFHLGKQAALFRATVAINDTSNWCFSPATFTVWGDGKELWRSQWIAHNHTKRQQCQVQVKGIKLLELRVECVNGNTGVHAVWVEPRVLQKVNSPDPVLK